MRIHTISIPVLLTLLWLPAILRAQSIVEERFEYSPAAQEYMEGLAAFTAAFWTPKMNGYKVAIDRMLSASDLVRLNELRARTATIEEELENIREKLARESRLDDLWRPIPVHRGDTAALGENLAALDAGERGAERIDEESDRSARERAAPEEMMERLEDFYDDDDDDGYGYDPDEMDEEELERYGKIRDGQLRTNIALLDLLMTNGDAMVAEIVGDQNRNGLGYTYEKEYLEMSRLSREKNEIDHICNWIARNYRRGMEALLAGHAEDLEEFFDAVRTYSRGFVRSRGEKVLENHDLAMMMAGVLIQPKYQIGMIEGAASSLPEAILEIRRLEALLMLHTGHDLRAFRMTDNGAPGSPSKEDASTLGQNSPNPASTRTTIPYTLPEPGSSVTLKILDTRGALVATYDQGARQAGEHALSIDVSALAPGTYLYQLTVTTGGGERVFSKGFQVVR